MTRHVARRAPPSGSAASERWESLVTEAVGSAIEFWGFKHNHGRVWALLYLRGEPLSAGQIQHELDLSKGAVSMVIRELEQWGVVERLRGPGREPWRFRASTDLMGMIGRVLGARESGILDRIADDLAQAEREARRDHRVPRDVLDRLGRLRRLASLLRGALQLFLRTSHLDLEAAAELLEPAEAEARPAPRSRSDTTRG